MTIWRTALWVERAEREEACGGGTGRRENVGRSAKILRLDWAVDGGHREGLANIKRAKAYSSYCSILQAAEGGNWAFLEHSLTMLLYN